MKLLTVDLERDRSGIDAGAALEPPELLPVLRVERGRSCRCRRAGEDHSPRRGEGRHDQRAGSLFCQAIFPVLTSIAVKVPHCSHPECDEGAPEPQLPRSKGASGVM